MIEYVKHDAKLPVTVPVKSAPVLDEGMKAKILELKEINEFTVRKVGARTRTLAREWLKQMHSEGELKTKAELVSELTPEIKI